jgi:plastocyanin
MLAVAIPKAASALAATSFHEKSKVAFYILAGLLAAWAVFVSFAGLRQPEFPDTPQIARGVMGISIALPVATAAAAVLTASIPPPAPPYDNGKAPVNGQKGTVPPPTPLIAAGGASGATGAAGAAPAATAPTAPAAAVTRTTEIDADPSGQLAFLQKTVKLKAGKDTIAFVNHAALAHNLTIQQGTGATGAFVAGTATLAAGSAKLTPTLKPGTYTFYCSVPGHRQAGMQGTITVQ